MNPPDARPSDEEFERHRRRLFGLAYRMLSSAADAEDVVQDAYLRWTQAHAIEVPLAWLTTVVTNLCLNRLTSARAQRESYPGPWLPEPVLTDDGALGPLDAVEQRESVALGVLILLERLSPAERAVFVLCEAFGYPHREIAEILHVEEAHSRQLLRRARQHVDAKRGRFPTDEATHRRIVEAFIAAARSGDMERLRELLSDDVVVWTDGGGRTAARRPIRGRDRVLRYVLGIGGRPEVRRTSNEIAHVNGEPALLVWDGGTLTAVVAVEVTGDRIDTVRMLTNEAKLGYAATQSRIRPGS
ncbi:RNA polymerase sigma factor SigJ [Spiractinospora alimapuensis]|uniref:RNA polymerase sigma factor SigJ n=1 Tax=Spiractinospora alimapuensis TaxID=2820884 RepID=UPI001F1C124C|nr:RNA polymerase sigma factor SigJ [Spiractinospora alimapuensis]QVQ52824.1 RNA polymerase sigma factor SigJ [Spiractinospora alimapuensis]